MKKHTVAVAVAAVAVADFLNASAQRISTSGAFTDPAVGGNHEFLQLSQTAAEAGYAYIYVSNETPNSMVYFDDLLITHTETPILQKDDYYPFGLTFGSYSREGETANKFLYNGKESQDDLGLDWMDYGWRMYDPAIARWSVIDPLSDKFTAWSPYNYTFNNPIVFVDPNGLEGIVVSGQPGNHKNKLHFLVNGLDRSKSLQAKYDEEGNDEKVTWIVYNNGDPDNGGYTDEQISEYQELAEEAGITMQVVSDSDEIVDYVNDKNGGDSRENDQVSDFSYIGHALPGELSVGYENDGWINELTHDSLDPSDFDADAFTDDSNANLVGGCRTCVNPFFGNSAAEKMSLKVGGEVKGTDVRVYYVGGVVSDEVLVKKNGGKIITIPGKKKKKK